MKKTKCNNLSILEDAKPNKRKLPSDYEMIFSFRERPISDAFLENLAAELVAWCETDEALKLNQFLRARRIGHDAWSNWTAKNKTLADAAAYALRAIGDRREIGALTRKYDANIVLRSMPNYDEDWVKICKFHSELSQGTVKQATVINVYDEDSVSAKERNVLCSNTSASSAEKD